jgi:exopolysaccharide biosynthesis polyprenyl glycosylphosphotransferase
VSLQSRQRRLLAHFWAFTAADVSILALAGIAGWLQAQPDPWTALRLLPSLRPASTDLLLAAGVVFLWHYVFRTQGLYRSRRMGLIMAEWWDITRAASFGTLMLAGLVVLFDRGLLSRAYVVTFWATALVGSCVMRTTLRLFLGEVRRKGHNLRNVVIVGSGLRGQRVGTQLRAREEMGYHLLGYVDDGHAADTHAAPILGTLDETTEILSHQQVDEVIVALPVKSYYQKIAEVVTVCEELGITVRIPADFFHLRLATARMDRLGQEPILTLQTPTPSVPGLFLKRSVDFVGSLFALLLLTPLFAVIAVAIKLDSKGPVLFAQERVGIGRRRFRMFKFRSMVVDAEARMKDLESQNEASGAAFKIRNDPRVTAVGRFIRRYSLDELPQFWNVLVGDMSMVGPRPMSLRDAHALQSRWQKRRFSVKPGLTCVWQATGRHEVDFEQWMKLDLHYIDNWSIKLDFELMLKTVPAMIRGTGC